MIEPNMIEEVADDPKPTNKKVLVSDFETGKREVVEVDEISKTTYFTKPTASFVIAAGISVASILFGGTMLVVSGGTGTLIPFYTSLISGTISYWFTPPSLSSTNKPNNSANSIPNTNSKL